MECVRPAELKAESVKEIRALEQKLGVTIIAYEKVHPYKKLSAAGIKKLQGAEKETGAILVAYEA